MSQSQPMLPEWKKGHARINPTVAALLSRGVDTFTALDLHGKGWTLGKLQQEQPDALKELGLQPDPIQRILDSTRPPIPFDTLAEVLVASRMTCCVCKKSDRGVIVHHLIEWSESHDHSEQNLAVLCLIDHDRAHSKFAHTQNLTPALIQQFKEDWKRHVDTLSTRAILTASEKDAACWWYFNRTRLFALAEEKSVPFQKLSRFKAARTSGLIAADGQLLRRNQRANYSMEGGDGGSMYAYLKEVFDEAISSVSVLNISDDLDRSFLRAILQPGHLCFLQGSFKFLEKTTRLRGPGQTVEMYRQVNGVRVSTTIDRWEATSNSAWSSYLKGVYEVGALLRVVAVGKNDGDFCVQGSALAIGAPFEGMKEREYSNAPYRRGYHVWIDGEEDVDEDE